MASGATRDWDSPWSENEMARNAEDLCQCGHVRDAHEHYRRGSDCSVCSAGDCAKFRAAARAADPMNAAGANPYEFESDNHAAS